MSDVKNGVNKSLQSAQKVERNMGQSKKLSFKGFSIPTPKDHFNLSWNKLKKAVVAVFESHPIEYTLEELYRDVENLCSIKMGNQLYEDLKKVCEGFVNDVLPVFGSDSLSVSYLKAVASAWELYCRKMLMIRSIFLFMDRQLAVHNSETLSLWDLGLNLMREKVLLDIRVRHKLLDAITVEIKLERQGETVDRQLLRSLVRMYSDLQLYRPDFENHFLAMTQHAYHIEAQDLVTRLEVGEYLGHVSTRLREEEDRVSHYLEGSTRAPLLEVLFTQLISEHMDQLVANGLVSMMDAKRKEQLEMFYSHFSMVSDGVEKIRSAFASYIKAKGRLVVDNPDNDTEKDKMMTKKLLDLKDDIADIVTTCFHNDSAFNRSVNDAFEEFINRRPNKPAEYLAKFLDSRLRSGNKGQTEEELDRLMDKVMILFRFIHGKDVFEAFYVKELAKRLLMGKSASVDAEKALLSKLKQECGPNYTKKMETMFQDIELSRQLSKNFRQAMQVSHPNRFSIDLAVNVICPASWPTYRQTKSNYPSEMFELRGEFTTFYQSHHHGRKLIFEATLGTCVVRADFPTSPECRKELQVSEHQALVLLEFNGALDEEVSYESIFAATGIEEQELKRTLLSLSVGKGQRVLLKSPMSLEVAPEDKFHFNKDFRHRLMRIKFNQVQLKETKEEQEKTEERVFADRVAYVDCTVVRIMKMRKSIDHNALLSETYSQLKFPLKAADVKKRIESLIERDYIKRDSHNAALYHYIA